jgi:hypothetical protein
MRALLLICLATAACGTTRISATATVTPLMLGQVRYIGPGVGKLPQSGTATTFVATASSHQGGAGDLRWHSLASTVPHAFDLAVADLPLSERTGVLAVSPITCELRQWFALFVSILNSECVLQTASLATYAEPAGPKPLH